ncbi:MAG TPA: hypothetical protein VGH49_08350 [Xanthobacteraceae bacterium]
MTAAIIGLLTTAAYAQTPSLNLIAPNNKLVTQEDVQAQQDRDSAYKSAISKVPGQKATNDPWGTVRSTTPSKNQTGARSQANSTPK